VLLKPGEDPVPLTSVVNLDAVESVSLATLVERLGRLSAERMRQSCDAPEIPVAREACLCGRGTPVRGLRSAPV
jgi:mRNA interferase MazF